MARSKVKGTNGKPLKKGTNRDKLKASIRIKTSHHKGHGKEGAPRIERRNDGDPHVYHRHAELRDHKDGSMTVKKTERKVRVPAAANPISTKGRGARDYDLMERDNSRTVKRHLDKQEKKNKGPHSSKTTKTRIKK